jgi:hypothetical protein
MIIIIISSITRNISSSGDGGSGSIGGCSDSCNSGSDCGIISGSSDIDGVVV